MLSQALADEEVWWIIEQMERGGIARSASEIHARWEAEDAEAETILRPLLESQYRFASANIIRKRRYQTGGVVRLLCNAVRRQCAADPPFALMLAETACFIADQLPDDYYPAGAVNELRGTAWKDYATACRFLSRLKDGFDGLKRAERAYRRLIEPGILLGIVDLARAGLAFEQEAYDAALQYVRAAAAIFEEYRVTSRYFEAKEVEAVVLHSMGDVETARATYETAFELADTIGDLDMKGRAARNLGIAYRDSGDLGVASRYFLTALQAYEALENRPMVVHTRWSIARLSLAAGNAEDVSRRLPVIVNELQALGMMADASRAQLDLAEALLILENFEGVEEQCRHLFNFFRKAEMLTAAMTAIAFLQEGAAARKLTRQHFEWVRKFLADLDRDPHLIFLPPPGD